MNITELITELRALKASNNAIVSELAHVKQVNETLVSRLDKLESRTDEATKNIHEYMQQSYLMANHQCKMLEADDIIRIMQAVQREKAKISLSEKAMKIVSDNMDLIIAIGSIYILLGLTVRN